RSGGFLLSFLAFIALFVLSAIGVYQNMH
ncbi:MAG: hypothetical protein RI923_1311, partial [Pseudomonadota bacterium]